MKKGKVKASRKAPAKRPETANGYGLEVGGPKPYLAYHFSISREEAETWVTEKYHKVVQVRILLRAPQRGRAKG